MLNFDFDKPDGIQLPWYPNLRIQPAIFDEADPSQVVRGDYYHLGYEGQRLLLVQNPLESQVNIFQENGEKFEPKSNIDKQLCQLTLPEDYMFDTILTRFKIRDIILTQLFIYDVIRLYGSFEELTYYQRVSLLNQLVAKIYRAGIPIDFPILRSPPRLFDGDLLALYRKIINHIAHEHWDKLGYAKVESIIFHSRFDVYTPDGEKHFRKISVLSPIPKALSPLPFCP